MRLDFLMTTALFALGTFLAVASGYILSRKERVIGLRLVGVSAALNAVFVFSYGGFLLSDLAVNKIGLNHLQYLAVPYFSVLWYMLSVQQHTGNSRFTPRFYVLLLTIPFLAMVANFLYPMTEATSGTWINHLLFSSHRLVTDPDFGSGFFGLLFTKAAGYYILMGFQTLLNLLSTVNYVKLFQKKGSLIQKRSLTLAITSFVGFVLGILTLTSPETAMIDFTPFLTGFFSLLIFVLLFKYELFELIPLAYQKIYQDSGVPILIFDRLRKLVSTNRATKALFKTLSEDVNRQSLDDFESLDPGIVADLSQKKEHEWKKTIKGTDCYFLARWMDLANDHGKITGHVLHIQDITAQKKELLRMQVFARLDDLTQLCNRRYFFQQATQEFDEAIEKRQKISVIMFDLDDFKEINDIYGHQAGDVILQDMAGLFAKELDPEALFSRYGGEEFIIFQRKQTLPEAAKTATKLCALLTGHVFVHDKRPIKITASFGVTGVQKQINQSLDNYIKEADDALYVAKKRGKKQVFVYSDEI